MAKRVNKKFLVILTVSVLGAGGAAVGVSKFLNRGDAAAAIAAGDRHLAAKEWEQAQRSYEKALRKRGDVSLIVKYGDVLHERVRNDPNLAGKDVAQWELALQNDPNHVPALQRMMDAAIKFASLYWVRPENWDMVRDRAARLAAADPGNARAKVWQHVAVIRAWIAAKPVAAAEIDQHVAALAELSAKDPADATAPLWIARAHLRRAEEALPRGADAVKAERDKALAAFAAVKTDAQRDNAALLFRYAQILMAAADQNLDGRPDAARVQEVKDLIGRAQAAVGKDHENYAELKLIWVSELRQQRKYEEAERVAREWLENFPNDMQARLTLAQTLRQGGRLPEAIEVLRQPAGDDAALKGVAGLRLKEHLERDRLRDLIQFRLAQHGELKGKPERDALRALMDDDLRRLAELSGGDDGPVLKLKGMVKLLGEDRESVVEGIRLLEEAHAKLNRSNNNAWRDPDLARQLADAYLTARDPRDRQPEQAKQLYAAIAAAYPRSWPARKRLTELYLRDKQYELAKPHVAAMEAEPELKGDADLMRYKIVLTLGTGNPDDGKRMATSLPERTPHEQWLKVNALQAAALPAEAEALARRLSEAELASANQKDVPGTQLLAHLLKRGGKAEEAIALVDRALLKYPEKSPARTQLEVQKLVLQGKAEDAKKMWLDEIAESPAVKAVRTAHLQVDQGRSEEAMQTLLEQDKRTPNTAALMEEIFQLALTDGKLTLADEYARKLKAVNADQSEGLSYEARLKLARRDLEGALRDATDLARKDTRATTFVILGQVQQAMGQPDAAVISYGKALERQNDNYEALRGIVERYLALNQIHSAEQFVRQGMQKERLAVFFQEVQRRIHEHHRDPREITKVREKAIEDNPDVPRGYVALAENQVKVAAFLAKQATPASLKESEAAIVRATETLKTAVGRWPDDITLAGRLSEMYLRLDKFPEALATIERLAERDKWKDKPEPWQLIASLRLRNKEALKANEAMETALKKSNNSFPVRQQMVAFHLQTGQFERGVNLLKELVAERPDDKGLRTQLIEVYVGARRFEDAEALVREVLAKDPADARMLSLRGFLRMNQGKFAEAHAAIAAALEVEKNYAPAYYYRGMLKLRVNDLGGAADDLGRARELNPTNVDMRSAMAEALKRRGQMEESTKELEAALQLAPMRKDLRSRLFDQYFAEQRWVAMDKVLDDAKNNPDLAGDPAWRKAEARMWLARDNADKAMAAIQVAARLAPQDPEVNLMFLEVLHRMKKYDEVLAVTDKVLADRDQPRTWWMYLQRTLALHELKRPAEAEAALDSALTATDVANDAVGAGRVADALVKVVGAEQAVKRLEAREKPYWPLEIAVIRFQRGEWSKAVAVADQFLKEKDYERLSPTQKLRALTLAGQIYTSSVTTVEGSLEKAEQAYVRFLSETERQQTGLNSQLQALNNLAFLFSDHPTTPNPQRALIYSKRAYDLMASANVYDVNVADTHGWVLVLSDRTDEGIEVLKAALAKKPLPDTHYHLGEAYLRKAQYAEAQKSFDDAEALLKQTKGRGGFVDPGLQDKLARALERLKQSNKSANAGGN